MRTKRHLPMLVAAAAGVVLAACGSGASNTSGGGSASSPTQLAFKSSGVPNMSGVTLDMGNAAGDATVGDTVAYLTSQILQQWGAKTSFQLGNGNNTELAVVSGQLVDTAGPLDTCIDAGLNLFGPNQVHVDYILVSSVATSVSGLKGRTVALATQVSPDQNLTTLVLQKNGLSRNDIHIFLSGSNSASLSALLKGTVQAAWVHADSLKKLKKAGTFNVLSTSAQAAPYLADSYMCAKPDWLSAHPAYAEAMDLAWIEAANVFNHNESRWVTAAVAYTKGADTTSEAQDAYSALQKADPWSLDKQAHFDSSDLAQNYQQAKSGGRLTGAGTRPESQWADFSAWQHAWSVYQAHQSTYAG